MTIKIVLQESRIRVWCWRPWWNWSILENQPHFLTMCIWGVLNVNANRTKLFIESTEKMFESRISAGATEKLPGWEKPHAKTVAWSYDLEGHAKKCVERYCELANKKTEQLYKSQLLAWMIIIISRRRNWNQLENCPNLIANCLEMLCVLARIGRPDILVVSEQTCSISHKMNSRACDRRWQARLTAYIHHTNDSPTTIVMWGNTAQHCRLGLFQDSDFAGDLEDSKSTSGGVLCIFGSRTFVPTSWMCKKQTSVSHSSTESEVISLDAGLRMDGIPALDLWWCGDRSIAFFKELTSSSERSLSERKGRWSSAEKRARGEIQSTTPQHQIEQKVVTENVDELSNVDHVDHKRNFFSFRSSVVPFFLKTMKLWSQRTEVLRWDTCPRWPTECVRLVVWQNQFWIPKSKSNMQTPRTNLLTCWPKVISHVMTGTIFFVCSTSWFSRCFPAAIFFQLKSRTPCRRAQLRKEGLRQKSCVVAKCQELTVSLSDQEVWARINSPMRQDVQASASYGQGTERHIYWIVAVGKSVFRRWNLQRFRWWSGRRADWSASEKWGSAKMMAESSEKMYWVPCNA